MKITPIALAAGVLLALPAVASAHVSLSPEEAPAGDFSRFTVNVPNERDDASTVKVTVKLPEGLTSVSFQVSRAGSAPSPPRSWRSRSRCSARR